MGLSKPACSVSLVSIKAAFNDNSYTESISVYLCPIPSAISPVSSGKNGGAGGTELAMPALWQQGFASFEGSSKLSLPYFSSSVRTAGRRGCPSVEDRAQGLDFIGQSIVVSAP